MDSKLVEDVGARIKFIKLALKHCGKCEDETCSACGFYETELGILKRCLESLRWIPVEERLPEPETLVLVSGGLAVFGHDGVWYSMTGDDSHRPIQWEVTKWMPIPQ